MAWVRLDDSFLDHPKFLDLDATSLRVWLRVLCYCNRHGTGGFVAAYLVMLAVCWACYLRPATRHGKGHV